jgi:YHS domain-containing protein
MTMTKSRNTVRKLFGQSPVVAAGLDVNTTQGLTLAGPGLALRGYDPVAYFAEGKPVIGKAMYTATYNKAAYQFATEANLQAFKANPEKYVPQYGGFCAFGASVGAKFDADPQLWKIVADKLYLNLNPDIQEQWEKDIPRHISKADKHWPAIKDKVPAELS